jgi:predicted DNA repair protein MutK
MSMEIMNVIAMNTMMGSVTATNMRSMSVIAIMTTDMKRGISVVAITMVKMGSMASVRLSTTEESR